jgi:hypothetical protein
MSWLAWLLFVLKMQENKRLNIPRRRVKSSDKCLVEACKTGWKNWTMIGIMKVIPEYVSHWFINSSGLTGKPGICLCNTTAVEAFVPPPAVKFQLRRSRTPCLLHVLHALLSHGPWTEDLSCKSRNVTNNIILADCLEFLAIHHSLWTICLMISTSVITEVAFSGKNVWYEVFWWVHTLTSHVFSEIRYVVYC